MPALPLTGVFRDPRVLLFLAVFWRYRVESLSVFIFPLVFVMALVSTLGNPVSAWSSPVVRNAWLTVHIVLVLLGYAALKTNEIANLRAIAQGLLLGEKPDRLRSELMLVD